MDVSERESALREDRAWLQALSDALHDKEYAALLHRIARLPAPPRLQEQGVSPELQAAMFGFGEDNMLSSIVMMAIDEVDAREFDHPVTDLMFMPTAIPTVNGFCVRTPSGVPAIVLNHGLVLYVSAAVHIALGLTTWTDGEYCAHHTRQEKVKGMFRLAEGVLAKQLVPVIDIKALHCLEDHDNSMLRRLAERRGTERDLETATRDLVAQGDVVVDAVYQGSCLIAEMFIVLHEIGHIALGHLNRNNVAYAFGERNVPVYRRSIEAEFEADRFAYRQLVKKLVSGGRMRHRDVAYGIGCLFMLQRTVEYLSGNEEAGTHPPAAERWQAIKAEMDEARVPAALDSVDHYFAWLDRMESAV
ncbi:phage exclusion protein Lit family protein [Actinokineospora fastidiosa]|uniref:Uncharacterized protein n=1 Tax=Actinokineospora fastidiosa TaxID=1816 RepID=A0A918LEF9_9PSEU|nr:phage exclusion protein Lit family protein [Actinokineospora fastidiosa]GGS35961.1 hypothetical protein GCM10010171_33230 [Actinokineospora fastidiosa]